MQKFGLNKSKSSVCNAVELEVVREQASALGRAGKKSQLSLERYKRPVKNDADTLRLKISIDEISSNVWELILQREFLGFTQNNLRWVKTHYMIPDEAINQLGKYG